jgi:hypothetical protein
MKSFTEMAKSLICAFFLATALLLTALPVCPAEELAYREITDSHEVGITWQIERVREATYFTCTKDNGQTYTSRYDGGLAVVEWHFKDPKTKTDIVAARKNNTIMIKGIFKGEPTDKKIRIDKDPWYQTLSFSLPSLMQSDRSSTTFWALRTDTLSPHKMRATKRGQETILIQGKEVETQNIRVKLAGFKAIFWHSDYWFRSPDGLFLKYRGVEGPPGTPETVMTLVSSLPQ